MFLTVAILGSESSKSTKFWSRLYDCKITDMNEECYLYIPRNVSFSCPENLTKLNINANYFKPTAYPW